jgi:RNA polymerase sigma factor (sigma-70 family)
VRHTGRFRYSWGYSGGSPPVAEMAVAVSSALEQIAGREAELARALHAQFRRRLTVDDARDAVADAIATAHGSRDELDGLDGDRLEAWVRTRAYRNAIDQIRAIDGYGAQKRQASVSFDDHTETLSEDGDVWQGLDDELAERFTDGAAAESVALAIERLTPDERRLLRLRHYDGLDVKTVAALLDIHPKKYERLHTRAIGKLRTIFIETTASEHCEPVRELIARSRREALAPALSAEIAAHVEACEQCRAYEKRSLKLIAALPLPVPALADRIWSRLHDLAPSAGSHGETIAAGATGTAAAGAGAGGAATGTGILAGVGAKVVAICAGTAVTTACVGAVALPVLEHDHHKAPHRPAKQQQAQRPAAQPAPAAVAKRPAVARPARTTARRTASGSGSSRSRNTGSLGIESFGTPTRGASSAPAARPPPRPPPSSKFSSEFSP